MFVLPGKEGGEKKKKGEFFLEMDSAATFCQIWFSALHLTEQEEKKRKEKGGKKRGRVGALELYWHKAGCLRDAFLTIWREKKKKKGGKKKGGGGGIFSPRFSSVLAPPEEKKKRGEKRKKKGKKG